MSELKKENANKLEYNCHFGQFAHEALNEFQQKNKESKKGVVFLTLFEEKDPFQYSKPIIEHSVSIIIKNKSDDYLRDFKSNLNEIMSDGRDHLLKGVVFNLDHLDDDSKDKLKKYLNSKKLTYIQTENKDIPKDKALEDIIHENNVNDMQFGNFDFLVERMLNSPTDSVIKTGFNNLDEALGGGLRFGRLYAIGGITSIGKTTFVMNIADNVASSEQDVDVLVFSLETGKIELQKKILESHRYLSSGCNNKLITVKELNDKAKAGEIKNVEELKKSLDMDGNKTKVSELYNKLNKRLYIYKGSGEVKIDTISEKLDELAKQNGRVPKLVIVDYLQIMASHNNKFNLSERQIVDKNITELKRICRDRDVAIIVVSSLNRDSYKDGEEVTLKSFKESGGIEYSCDVLMGLQLLGMKKKKNNGQNDPEYNDKRYESLLNASIRKVELVILKNRTYKARERIYFDYHAKFDCFLEKWEAPKSQVENSKVNLVGSRPGLIK